MKGRTDAPMIDSGFIISACGWKKLVDEGRCGGAGEAWSRTGAAALLPQAALQAWRELLCTPGSPPRKAPTHSEKYIRCPPGSRGAGTSRGCACAAGRAPVRRRGDGGSIEKLARVVGQPGAPLVPGAPVCAPRQPPGMVHDRHNRGGPAKRPDSTPQGIPCLQHARNSWGPNPAGAHRARELGRDLLRLVADRKLAELHLQLVVCKWNK